MARAVIQSRLFLPETTLERLVLGAARAGASMFLGVPLGACLQCALQSIRARWERRKLAARSVAHHSSPATNDSYEVHVLPDGDVQYRVLALRSGARGASEVRALDILPPGAPLPARLLAGELEEEVSRAPMNVVIRWRAPLFTTAEMRSQSGGGVYIMLSPIAKRALKVGQTSSFATRARGPDYERKLFLLGDVAIEGSKNPAGVLDGVEHAVARALIRSRDLRVGRAADLHKSPVRAFTAAGPILVRNLLPPLKQFAKVLERAHRLEPAPAGARAGNRLDLRAGDQWEVLVSRFVRQLP